MMNWIGMYLTLRIFTVPRQTIVVKTESDSSIEKTLGNRCECHGFSEMTIITGCPCYSRCGTLKNPHCSMAMSVEQRSKFAALHRQLWRLHMSEKFSSGTKKTNKQTNTLQYIGFFYFYYISKYKKCIFSNSRKEILCLFKILI